MPGPAPPAHDLLYWQQRAAKMRALAEERRNSHMRGMLLEIASGFDLLAQRAEKLRSEGNPREISITNQDSSAGAAVVADKIRIRQVLRHAPSQ